MLNSYPHIPSNTNRYFVVYDDIDREERIYGILRLDCVSVRDGIEIQFFNEVGNINLRTREVSQADWETYREFDLFPVLRPFNTQQIIRNTASGNVVTGAHTTSKKIMTQFMVNFRDY